MPATLRFLPLGRFDSIYTFTLYLAASNAFETVAFLKSFSPKADLNVPSSFYSVIKLVCFYILALLALMKSGFFTLESLIRSCLATFAFNPNLVLVVRYLDYADRLGFFASGDTPPCNSFTSFWFSRSSS